MTRHLAIAIGLAALALPALAQDRPYDYQDDNGSAWSDEPPPPGEGSYSEYPAEDSRVDVNVDIGAPGASVSFDTFRDGLAPYGEWVTVNGYGRVWRPANVAAGWRPYYYGRWEWTDEGWLWVSDESWGWATYHYGRWAMDPSYGWVWVPGYQWAPAWVTWRYSPDYIGWAPLGPGFSVYVTSYPVNYAWWSFVPCNRFVGVPVFSVAFTGAHVRGIFHNTYPAPPRATVFGAPAPAWGGPARPFIERRVGHTIAPVRVQPVGSPGAMAGAARGGVVPIYRPEARPAPGGRPSAVAPSRPWGPAPGRGPAVAAPRQGAPVQPQGGGVRPVDPRRSGGWRGNPQSAPPQGAPRQYVPAPQGGPRQYAPPPQQQRYAPGPQGAPRQYAPAPQGGPRYAPAPQGAPRQYAPAPQGGSAPRPQAAPQGQHGGGGGGGHGSAQAPAHRRD